MPLRLLVCLTLAASLTVSCSNSSSDSFNAEAAAIEDAEGLQSLLSTLEASQALGTPAPAEAPAEGELPLGETIGTWNAADLPATPDAMYALFDTGNGYARFPAEGDYISDFYATEGFLAAVELRPTTDGWGEYQARLYVYPSLSTSVRRTLEEYRLDGDSWDNLIEGPQGQTFEQLKTEYFDGREESSDLLWSRNWVDVAGSQIYEATYFDIQDDFTDPTFDYPETITPPATTPVPLSDAYSYASHTEGTISHPSEWNGLERSSIEFYNQPYQGTGSDVEKHTKRFEQATYDSGKYEAEDSSVSIVFENVNGDRAERTKVVSIYTRNQQVGYTSGYTSRVDVSTDVDARVVYDRETQVFYKQFSNPYQTMNLHLEETAVDSAAYTGILVYTVRNRVVAEYIATLDATNGLQLRGADSKTKTEVDFPVSAVSHTSPTQNGPQMIVISSLERGGNFAGRLSGGTLQGVYTDRMGTVRQISVTRTSIELDGELVDPPEEE